MANTHERDTLNRILDINWRGGDATRRCSQLALFDEYLRRVGLWCTHLGWTDAHPIVSDMPSRVAPNTRATPVNTTLMQQSLRTLGQTSVYERMLMTHVLNWSAAADKGLLALYDLPDLYEPLLWFYERGGWLSKGEREGEWNISGVLTVFAPLEAYATYEPLALEVGLLNAIDNEATC